MKKFFSILLSAVMLFSLCACSSNNSTAGTDATEETVEAVSYPMTFEDAYGNEVTLEAEPQTVISVSPAITEIIYALGAQDRLIGRSDYDDYPAEVMDVQSVGAIDTPDIELITSLNPDVVLASSIFSEESYNAITELGIPVIIIKDETSLDGMFTMVSTVADAVGVHEAGTALVNSMTERLASLEEAAPETDATVFYCMYFGEDEVYTAGGDTFINGIIEAAGAVNAAADATGWSYSVEQLIAQDPDYILVPSYSYDSFITTEPYSSLTAVSEGHVIAVDSNLFERQGPRNLDAIELIENAISENADDAAA